jgi:hypothetical protein
MGPLGWPRYAATSVATRSSTPADAAFDDIADLAATVVGPPIAAVNVVYADQHPAHDRPQDQGSPALAYLGRGEGPLPGPRRGTVTVRRNLDARLLWPSAVPALCWKVQP